MGYVGYPLAFGYFPCKNDLPTAARLASQGGPPYAASTSEMAVYAAHAAALRALGAHVAPARERVFHGVPVLLGPAVVLAPAFCPCLSLLRPKLPHPGRIAISERSTLLVDGTDVCIEQLELDGALEVRVCAGASLTIRSLHVRNDGWQFDQLSDAVLKSASCPDVLRIRGYTLRKNGGRTIAVEQPGAWVVEDGVLHIDAGGKSRRLSQPAVGGAILGDVPPPAQATWSSSELVLAPGSTMRVPLVLGAPSRVTLDVDPTGGGLHLSLLPELGPAVLPPTYVPPSTPASAPPPAPPPPPPPEARQNGAYEVDAEKVAPVAPPTPPSSAQPGGSKGGVRRDVVRRPAARRHPYRHRRLPLTRPPPLPRPARVGTARRGLGRLLGGAAQRLALQDGALGAPAHAGTRRIRAARAHVRAPHTSAHAHTCRAPPCRAPHMRPLHARAGMRMRIVAPVLSPRAD